MFGKINFSFSKPTQTLQNAPTNLSKPANPPQTQNKPQNSHPAINSNTNNQHSQKPNYQRNNLSNPTFSKFNNKQNLQSKNQEHQHGHDENKTKKIKKIQNFNQSKKGNMKKPPAQSLQSQMQGSKFRILNQLLYTTSSQQAMSHFQQNPQDYKTYHEGYRFQSQKWESKPVNVIIKYFRKQHKNYKDKTICDLGCGEGFLFEGLTKEKFSKQNQQGVVNEVKNKHIFKASNILSFDLVALKPFIKVADIKNLPLQKQSVDVTVFCLSLMGKNYLDFIQEAHRVLKKKTGELVIAQVESRSKDWKAFVQMVEMIGFRLINNGVALGGRTQGNQNKRFGMLHFVKIGDKDEPITRMRHQGCNYRKQELKELSQILLTQCIYKKR